MNLWKIWQNDVQNIRNNADFVGKLLKLKDFVFPPASFSECGDASGADSLFLGDAAAGYFPFHGVGEVNQRINVTLSVTLRKRKLHLKGSKVCKDQYVVEEATVAKKNEE